MIDAETKKHCLAIEFAKPDLERIDYLRQNLTLRELAYLRWGKAKRDNLAPISLLEEFEAKDWEDILNLESVEI